VFNVVCAADERRQRRILHLFPCYKSALVGQITDARRESEPKQVHQGKLKIREAGRIADEAPLQRPQGR